MVYGRVRQSGCLFAPEKLGRPNEWLAIRAYEASGCAWISAIPACEASGCAWISAIPACEAPGCAWVNHPSHPHRVQPHLHRVQPRPHRVQPHLHSRATAPAFACNRARIACTRACEPRRCTRLAIKLDLLRYSTLAHNSLPGFPRRLSRVHMKPCEIAESASRDRKIITAAFRAFRPLSTEIDMASRQIRRSRELTHLRDVDADATHAWCVERTRRPLLERRESS
jgi:hypothetical protein